MVKLVDANLNRCMLVRVSLMGADLRGARLVNADLVQCSLRGARLNGADLTDVDLHDTDGISEAQMLSAVSIRGAVLPEPLKSRLRYLTHPPEEGPEGWIAAYIEASMANGTSTMLRAANLPDTAGSEVGKLLADAACFVLLEHRLRPLFQDDQRKMTRLLDAIESAVRRVARCSFHKGYTLISGHIRLVPEDGVARYLRTEVWGLGKAGLPSKDEDGELLTVARELILKMERAAETFPEALANER